MSKFAPIRSFYIDDGELDGMTPQEIFVLGYELARVDELIDSCESFTMPLVHADNIQRIESNLFEKGFACKWTFCAEDQSENWVCLEAWINGINMC